MFAPFAAIFGRLLYQSQFKDITKVYIDQSEVIAAGILQGQFFNYERPNYMNYAGIGFILGHELTHASDDTGRQTDKDGRLRNWWSDATTKTFVDKAQCIIDQYSKISYPGVELTLSGINTQGENIADNGGMTEAYLAYKSWVEKHGEELPLPGLNYTLKQTFWISAANAWCSKERIQYLKQIVMSDPHPPSYYRIIGTLSNSKQFAEDFQCPVGSRMNPVHKCTIW